jgi:hypothetical protein
MNMLRLLIVVLTLLAVAPAVTVDAASIQVEGATAEASFPDGITFNLSATSKVPIVKAELLYTQAEIETLHLDQAAIDPSTSIQVSMPVDFRANYVPPGIDIFYRWRLTDESGGVLETEPQSVTWTDSRFDWQEISTDQVTVFFYNGDEEFSRTILESAQSTIDRLQTDFTVERSRNIRIWVYDSKSDFQGSQAPNSQEWIAGTAYPELQVILAVLPSGNSSEVGRIVPHEISHQVLYQATRNPFNVPPTWFDEGMAVSAQASGNEDFPALVERAAEDGRLFSVRSLTSEFPYDPADATLAYAESYSIVQFIINRWGNEGIAAVLDAYKLGVSHDEAFMTALGVDMTELDRLWKESLNYNGDSGIAGGIGSPGGGQSDTSSLIVDATSVILVVVALISGVAMVRRFRRERDPDDEPDLVQFAA